MIFQLETVGFSYGWDERPTFQSSRLKTIAILTLLFIKNYAIL